ncbi:Membrane fusion protein of RND family multidrug efflux pump [Rhodopirellula islandica]|uniref:Membrane fusion protein of RND family multidrug efflux pump n=1 Tax=Rhodopirellula islandica TaxID=595434 RepID=A0A0J1BLU2_RHOIS|nr:efflux RND transporter periplasmic adaptor subunit [Rhodopirellula islandica]KLU07450.1 Membrane fusion protein of RND family multidrug efflux pump [Rhodopirellula islandica]
MNDASKQRPQWRWLRILGTIITCLAILGASAAAVFVINRTEPTAQQINATRKSAALVETIPAERGNYSPQVVVLGTVEPAQDITVSPRVSGQVIELSPEFIPGGMVRQGERLLRIDPADFENAISISNSELLQKDALWEIEQARQRLAVKELEMLEGTIDDTNRGLVLREPQIASIKAEMAAAKAAMERAQLDLDRTEVTAPFDAHVLSRSVNIGSQVGPGDELGRLIGLDEYWIMAAVPVRTLRWVQFPETAEDDVSIEGSKVILRHPDAWGPGVEREGRVARLIGTLDQQTRLARVLITVPDPLGRESKAPPLILDTLIETQIEGREIQDVVRLPRDYVRNQDTVWVMKDEQLEIRETQVVFRDAEYAYIRDGIEAGEDIVITTLATVANGVGLRKITTEEADPNVDSDETERATE